MIDKDNASKGPKKRDPGCLELRHAILIPKGTILRQDPGASGDFSCPVGFGKFTLDGKTAGEHPDDYKRVIA